MSDPSDKKLDLKQIWQLNMRFLLGALAFYLGWLCWTNATVFHWPLWLFGGILMLGGGTQFLAACFKTIGLILSQIKWGKFRKQGVKPRADRMARDNDFIDGGRGS